MLLSVASTALSVRRALLVEVAGSLIQSLICTRVDYCNSYLFGAPATNIRCEQTVHNSAVRFICRRSKFDHITDVICDELHWLLIRQRIEFKVCLQTYKCLHNAAPSYLTRYCQPISTDAGRCHLRSAANGDLVIQSTKSTSGTRSFAVASPKLWNKLPSEIRDRLLFLTEF